MKASKAILAGACAAIVFLAAGFCAAADEQVASGTSQPAEWALPASTDVRPLSLKVTADNRFAFYMNRIWASDSKSFETQYMMLNVKTGEAAPVLQFLPKDCTEVLSVEVGSDARYALVASLREKKMAALYVLDLVSMQAKEIQNGMLVSGHWVGGDIAVSSSDKKSLRPVEFVSPVGKKLGEWKMRAMVMGGSDDGKTFLCLADPQDSEKKVTPIDKDRMRLVIADRSGQVGKVLMPLSEVGPRRVISSGGKYVAMQKIVFPPDAPLGTEPTISIEVSAARGAGNWSIFDNAAPIAVLDSGDIVSIAMPTAAGTTAIRLWTPKGDARLLVADAEDGVVRGSTLYYVARQQQPMIRMMNIK